MKTRKRLIVFMGMIATGKSTLAKELAGRLQCPHYNTDVIRKEITGGQHYHTRTSRVDSDIYTPEISRKIYGELLERAEKAFDLPGVHTVILDGSYQSRAERERLLFLLGKRCKVIFFHCVAGDDILAKRMEQRSKDVNEVSDGRWEVYVEQKRRFEYPRELNQEQLVILDTDRDLPSLLHYCLEQLKE